jgi:hypothetical protein
MAIRRLPELERFAIEAVVRHFAAEPGEGDATIMLAGRRIAVTIAAFRHRRGERSDITVPRLRYDKVALRFMRDAEAALHETVPRRTTVVLTISAPIKLATKTVAALHERIRTRLADRSHAGDAKLTILGNQIRARILAHGAASHPKAIGFVHTATPNADILLDAAQAMLEAIDAAKRTRGAGERWLVLVAHDDGAAAAIYRQVVARLAGPVPFAKVLLVGDAGRIETLKE